MTNDMRSLFPLAELKSRRHSHWVRREFQPGDYSMVETDETDEILALVAVVEAAQNLRKWQQETPGEMKMATLGIARGELDAALSRIDFGDAT